MSKPSTTEQVVIFDTTLRDGEQSPGISLDAGEKLEIAEQLARLGVDYIEAGFPIASQGDFEAVHAIASSIEGPTICGLSRTAHKDIDRCWEAIQPAAQRRIHTFIATSPTHMEHKLKMSPAQVLTEAASAVTRAREYTDDVEFSPEDASRSDFDFMCDVLQAAVDAGAGTLNIPDTVGFATPVEWAARIRAIRERVSGNYVLSTHCHNDLGLAVANSLAAVEAGARQVECTINGIGERAGNAAMEEIVMAIRTRPDTYADIEVDIRTEELAKSSRIVSRLTGYPVQYNKAVVGRNAFAHEAGIHQHGVLNERTTYEIMDPAAVGQGESQLVLGKHSGRAAFSDALLEALAIEELGGSIDHAYEFVSLDVRGGNLSTPSADLVMRVDGEEVSASCEGDGMVDASCTAIKQATGAEGRMTDYNVTSVTGGVDALADVALTFESNDGVKVSGRGLSTDVVEASARAFIGALNKIARIRESGEDPNAV